jgi:hypothetical protein
MALIDSGIHWVWIDTVCVRMRTNFAYSNTLRRKTVPDLTLSEQNKADLTREHYFPSTIAEMCAPERMDKHLR